MERTIYTLGYAGFAVETLRQMAEDRRAIVIDTRMSPTSRDPQWLKPNLLHALGDQYRHVKGFGNKNFRGGGGIALLDPVGGVREVRPILEQQSVILICACWSFLQCHRSVVAVTLQEAMGLPIVHLTKGDAPKTPPKPKVQVDLFGD